MSRQSLQQRRASLGAHFLSSKQTSSMVLSSSELPGAWSERSSVPLDTGQVGGSHSRQAREEPGSERPGLGLQLLGTQPLRHRRPALPGCRPCFPSAREQGPWRHLTLRMPGNQGHGPHSI